MPIYEYRCRQCQHQFEQLVLHGTVPTCPACNAVDLDRLISMFTGITEGTKAASSKRAYQRSAAIKRDKDIADSEHLKNHRH